MKRLMAIDLGQKRCGIAVTDPLQLVANGLTTVPTSDLPAFVADYIAKEPVEAIIAGYPRRLDGKDSDSMRYIVPALGRLCAALPKGFPVVMFDERYTSVLAHRAMISGGMKKMQRRNKGIVDEISATIMLNDYLSSDRITTPIPFSTKYK